MSVRALDPIGDWTFGAGRGNLLTGNPMIGQQINSSVKAILGDCFFAIDDGIDWFNLLGSKQWADLDLAIKTKILNVAGVTGLNEVTTTIDEDRNVSVTYSVFTIFSNQPFEGSVGFLVDNFGNFIVTDQGDLIYA